MCENITAMICRASALKSDRVEFKRTLISVRACENCDNFSEENLEHVIMQGEKHTQIRTEITHIIKDFNEVNQTEISQ